jgi:hypothetical protein
VLSNLKVTRALPAVPGLAGGDRAGSRGRTPTAAISSSADFLEVQHAGRGYLEQLCPGPDREEP